MAFTYAQAKLDPAETRFFEAHGTGTPVGDPIEAGAIAGMFAQYRSKEEPLIVGALKSNVGHSEGNSGIASFIKGVLCLESGIIPANANHTERNPAIPDEWNLHFANKAMAWPESKSGVRRVSINSFGVSGTNVHVIVDDAFHFLKQNGYDAPHRTVETTRLQGATCKSANAS
jgi:acyl transferase domain-containing protein